MIFISKSQRKIDKITSCKQIPLDKLYKNGLDCDSCYDVFLKFRPYLQNVNFDNLRMPITRGIREPLITTLSIPILVIDNRNVDILPHDIPVRFYSDTSLTIYQIDYNSIPDGYYYGGYAFGIIDNSAYLFIKPVNALEVKNNEKIIGIFDIDNNKLTFNNFADIGIPPEYQENGLYFDQLYPIIKGEYVFFVLSTTIYNLVTKNEIVLPVPKPVIAFERDSIGKMILGSFETSIRLIDINKENANLQILYSNNNDYYIALFSNDNTLIYNNFPMIIP